MTPAPSTSWFSIPQPRPAAAVRLLCFPPAGAGASLFHGWSDALPSHVEVLSAQLPGREARFKDTPFTDMARLVDEAVASLDPLCDKPFAFFGHSLGGWVCFELARRLAARRSPGPVHLLVAGCGAPDVAEPNRPIHRLPDEAFLAEIKALNGTPEAAMAHPELLALVLPALRADFTVYETYEYRRGPVLGCPISALGGRLDPRVSQPALEAWSRHTSSDFALHMLDGDHFFLNTAKPEVVRIVSAALRDTTPA